MVQRTTDGSAGDADYGTIGSGYTSFRQPDQRIQALIEQALAGVRTVVNIGAGAFFIAAAVTMIITVFTISYQSITSALANPVKSLRTE